MSLDKANQWAYDNPGKFIVATFISYVLCFSCVFVFLDSIGPEEEKPELVSPEEVSKILGYDPADYSFMNEEEPKYYSTWQQVGLGISGDQIRYRY